MLVETNCEWNAEEDEHSTEDFVPHPLVVLQVGHLDHDQHGEYPHDSPLCKADTKKVLDVR